VKLTAKRVLDEIAAAEQPCLAAAFCSYTFDPAFFENQVLRVALRLNADPEEQPGAYLDEAQRALQQVPVAVTVDAAARGHGKRLPYDLLLIRSRTFHPKLVLVVYETHARVVIGSANLTRPGYEENVELLFARSLAYDSPADRLSLVEIDRFLASSASLATAPGTQLAMVREELKRRLDSMTGPEAARTDHKVVSSFDRPLLDQLFDGIPDDAKIERIGVLAPFYERDDEQALETEGMDSVLRALVERRSAKGVAIDIATGWDDATVAADSTKASTLVECIGSLCAWKRDISRGGVDRPEIEYVTLLSIGPSSVSYADERGQTRRGDLAEIQEAFDGRAFWPCAPPTVHVPATILTRLRREHELRLLVQPGVALDDGGRPMRRGLHAKLFMLATSRKGKLRTYMLMGSPNASRMAMLRSVPEGANVELGVITVLDGHFSLEDALPSLIVLDIDRATLTERTLPALEPDPGAAIRDAVYDAVAKQLTVEWSPEAAALGGWSLRYDRREVCAGHAVPAEPTVIAPFELLAGVAELELLTGDQEAWVPIRVADLTKLPLNALPSALGLRELLALLGRRFSAERFAAVIGERGLAGGNAMLDVVFGEGFTSSDVFKAWWGIADDLEQPLSVPAFIFRLRGPLGVEVVWKRLQEAADSGLVRDEAWLYGCELARTLQRLRIPRGPDHAAKLSLLQAVIAEISASLSALMPSSAERPWLGLVADFYARPSDHA
jgi:hypothetical protein